MFDTAHIHPMLVHFPIALGLLGWLLEGVARIRKKTLVCGEIILYFATASAILAASAGALFTPDFTISELAAAKNIHSTLAGVTVTLYCIAALCYIGKRLFPKLDRQLGYAGFSFYTLAALFVGITGYFGGVLVYNDLLGM